MASILVAIVGNSEIIREGLCRILDERSFDIVATGADAGGLRVAVGEDAKIDIIVVDVGSTADGQAACRELRGQFLGPRIVLLGDDLSVESAAATIALGIDGYLSRYISCDPLARSLKLIAAGEKVLPSETVVAMSACGGRRPIPLRDGGLSDVNLSPRETIVLRCLTRGIPNKAISRELSISEATVKVHVKAITRKLKVLNRTQAALCAVSMGLIDYPVHVSEPFQLRNGG